MEWFQDISASPLYGVWEWVFFVSPALGPATQDSQEPLALLFAEHGLCLGVQPLGRLRVAEVVEGGGVGRGRRSRWNPRHEWDWHLRLKLRHPGYVKRNGIMIIMVGFNHIHASSWHWNYAFHQPHLSSTSKRETTVPQRPFVHGLDTRLRPPLELRATAPARRSGIGGVMAMFQNDAGTTRKAASTGRRRGVRLLDSRFEPAGTAKKMTHERRLNI